MNWDHLTNSWRTSLYKYWCWAGWKRRLKFDHFSACWLRGFPICFAIFFPERSSLVSTNRWFPGLKSTEQSRSSEASLFDLVSNCGQDVKIWNMCCLSYMSGHTWGSDGVPKVMCTWICGHWSHCQFPHGTGMSHATTASRKPYFRAPGGWATSWSTEEMLDRQHQRVNFRIQARTAHKNLPQKGLEEDLCLIVSRVSPTTQ